MKNPVYTLYSNLSAEEKLEAVSKILDLRTSENLHYSQAFESEEDFYKSLSGGYDPSDHFFFIQYQGKINVVAK